MNTICVSDVHNMMYIDKDRSNKIINWALRQKFLLCKIIVVGVSSWKEVLSIVRFFCPLLQIGRYFSALICIAWNAAMDRRICGPWPSIFIDGCQWKIEDNSPLLVSTLLKRKKEQPYILHILLLCLGLGFLAVPPTVFDLHSTHGLWAMQSNHND